MVNYDISRNLQQLDLEPLRHAVVFRAVLGIAISDKQVPSQSDGPYVPLIFEQ